MVEWKTIPLSDYATVKMGQSPPSEYYNDEGQGMPFIQGNRNFQNKYTNYDTYTSKITKKAEKGDVLLSVRAPVGDVNLAPQELCIGRGIAALTSVDDDNEFLFYLLKTVNFSNYESGTIFGSVNKNTIESLEVSIPVDKEHRMEIGHQLSLIDNLIDINSSINDYLSDLASEIFNHYIGSIRSKMPFENLISLGSGGTPRTSVSEYWNGQIPFFSPKDVSGCYVYKTEKNITQDGLNNCNSRLYPQNTIIITARGTVGKICLTAKPMAMNQSCYAVLSKNGTVYTTYLLCKYIVKKLKHKASGAVFDAITAQDILKEEIPNIDSTTAIMLESRLSHIFTMILKIGEESARLIQIRDCLLKDLFLSSR